MGVTLDNNLTMDSQVSEICRSAAPTVWNSLPEDIRACTFYGSFTRQLKTFYFYNAF